MITVHTIYGDVQLVKHVEKNSNYLYCGLFNKLYKFAEVNNSELKRFLYTNYIDKNTNGLNKILKRKSLCQ